MAGGTAKHRRVATTPNDPAADIQTLRDWNDDHDVTISFAQVDGVIDDLQIPAGITRDAEVVAYASPLGHAHAHIDTTGKTADDHHAKLHVHDGLDGSGVVAHASTSGITALDHHPAAVAGPDGAVAIDAAGAAGTAATFARSLHGHRVDTTAGPGANDTIDAAGAAGAVGAIARAGHGHRVDTTAGPGADDTVDGAGAAGAVGAIARAGHGHQVVSSAALPLALGAAAAGAAGALARSQHVHPTTGLSLTGHGAADHADITRKLFLPTALAKLDVATAVNLGASPNLTGAIAYADAATQGAFWTFEVPADYASGVITIQPVWSPGASDAVAHTVRWSMTCKTCAAGVVVTGAGTTVAFTGASLARVLATLVYDTATSTTLSPAAAGDLFTIELQRIGADAADTYVGVVNLLGIIVSYTANQ